MNTGIWSYDLDILHCTIHLIVEKYAKILKPMLNKLIFSSTQSTDVYSLHELTLSVAVSYLSHAYCVTIIERVKNISKIAYNVHSSR